MGFRKTHDIAVKVGSYEKDGQTKNRYENVGYVLTGDDGQKMHFINRTFNPAGSPMGKEGETAVLLSVFDVKGQAVPSNASAPPGFPGGPASDTPPNDIPF